MILPRHARTKGKWKSRASSNIRRFNRLSRFQDRIEDYLAFGVENIWIIDPESRTAYTATAGGLHPVRTNELVVPETPIRVVLSELFAELDRA